MATCKITKKVSYISQVIADIAIDAYNKCNKIKLHKSYQCKYCNKWHITKLNSKEATPYRAPVVGKRKQSKQNLER